MLKKETVLKYLKPLYPIPTGVPSGGKLNGSVSCILCDIYGTLFISGSGDISVASEKEPTQTGLDQLLFKFGIQKNSQTLMSDFFTVIEKNHQQLKNQGIDFPEIEIDRIWMEVLGLNDSETARDFACEFELIVNPAYPMPHLRELLTACERSGILIGIISNAQFFTPYLFDWFLHKCLEGLGFDPRLVFYSYRYGWAKPSTLMFEKAAEILQSMNILRSDTLYVGNDMLNDIYPAKRVGFQTALFAGDKRSLRLREDDSRCRDIHPDLVITDLEQLIKILKIDY